MAKSLNIRHKTFCSNVVKYKGNITKAYLATYPDSNYNSAGANAVRLIRDERVVNELHSLLCSNPATSPAAVMQGLSESLRAQRPLIIKDRLHTFPDYGVRLEAQKFIAKGYGFGNGNDIPNPSANIYNINNVNIDKIEAIITKLDRVGDKLKGIPRERSGEID